MTCSFAKEFSSSAFTNVENQFISEYLPIATGDAVKVYLYGLYLCQNPSLDQSVQEIAKVLGFTEKNVCDQFYFWEEFGLLSVVAREPFTVHYLPVRTTLNAKPRKFKAEKYTDFTKSLQNLISARMISTGEYTEYFSIMETYSIKPDAMLMIVKYCVDLKGDNIGYHYISKVAKDFGNRGLTTIEKIDMELSTYTLRTNELQQILHALSLKRQADYEDANYFKKWTSELNFEFSNILFAAKKIKKGGMAKLDSFLLELYANKSFSKEEITDFINKKQAVYDLTIKINKALSIYVEVLDTVIDNYTNRWLSYGFNEDALLFVANYCFRSNNSTLERMDQLLEELRKQGLIDMTSISDHFENQSRVDEFIKKFLLTVGVNRRPTPWDRENVKMWKSWNFTEEMILEAGKLASGKASPIPYVNGILSNWKNNDVFTVEGLSNQVATDNSQEAYNREYERRRSIAVSRAQKNTEKAFALNGFTALYGRLNSMEKDLAFAELSGNQQVLQSLEKEKTDLIAKVNDILRTINLTLEDLSPRYACPKCKDTGYVGTHRCDCFNNQVK